MERFLEPLFELPALTVYIVIGVLCLTEGAFFLGFVTPGELAVVTGGILASRGQLELDILVGVVLVATVLGNAAGFYVGCRWGADMLGWAPLQRFFGPPIRRTQDFMFRRGEWAIVLSRVSTPTRIIVPFLAGASGVHYRRFVLFDVPASLLWAATWGTLGFVLGTSWGVIREVSGTAALLVLILFILAVVIRWAAARIAANRRRVQALFRLTVRVTRTRALVRVLTPGFRWLSRRLDPRLARGLSLTIGFFSLLLAIGGIGLVLVHTHAVRGLALIDFPVLEWMKQTRTEEAVEIAETGLLAFDWPGVVFLALPLMGLALWRAGWLAALRSPWPRRCSSTPPRSPRDRCTGRARSPRPLSAASYSARLRWGHSLPAGRPRRASSWAWPSAWPGPRRSSCRRRRCGRARRPQKAGRPMRNRGRPSKRRPNEVQRCGNARER
ncbi:MAG: hypothetical protein GVY11_07300 [Gammaproteobacteria bacterium]|jgi:membrane protein DedA with SNARE-associated domain|nr:hypothetical protein [Gammaproteobacteria bacterium]